MKLTHIRLSGFKSFAESTVIVTPGQRIAVVGPNGCGKSNLIDAVRWVLGESRATNLRGEAMQDVIFSGSAQRRALGRASVELVFEQDGDENHSPWSVFRELSVKRVMTREGESTYYINNQAVRRKDVTDLFLGSGLGARSFAIIEQGMISKIIESKPEEMRSLLEEAAGITRYRERRKESESRLQSAREQLERLGDVRNEWSAQYQKLEVQAQQARQFKGLEDLKAKHEAALLICLKEQQEQSLREAEEKLLVFDGERDAAQERFEMAQQAAIEAREGYDLLQQQWRETQQIQAQAQVERARIQSLVREVQQQSVNLEEERIRLEQQQSQWQEEWEGHQASFDSVEAHQSSLQDILTEALEEESAAHEALLAADSTFHVQQKEWSEHQQRLSHVEQQRQTLKVRDEHIQKRLLQLKADQERTQFQLNSIPKIDPLAQEELSERVTLAETSLNEARLGLQQAELKLNEQRQSYELAQRVIHDLRQEAHSKKAKLEALLVVEKERTIADWEPQWAERPPFWSMLTVEAGWERAVEVVLRERFHARAAALESLDDLHWGGVVWSKDQADTFDKSKKTLVIRGSAAGDGKQSLPKECVPLWTKVKGVTPEVDAALLLWCAGTVVASSLEEALKWQDAGYLIQSGAVTPEGYYVDAVSVQCFVRKDGHNPVLAIKAEREEIELHYAEVLAKLEQQEEIVDRQKQLLEETELNLTVLRQQLHSGQEQWHQVNTELKVTTERQQRNQLQEQELVEQSERIRIQSEQEEQDRIELKFQAEEFDMQHEELMQERERIRAARNEADVRVSKARTALAEIQNKTRKLQQDHVRAEASQRQWEEKKNWLRQQQEKLEHQKQTLEKRVEQSNTASLDELMHHLEESSLVVEEGLQRLTALEKHVEQAQVNWKTADEARLKAERQLQDFHSRRDGLLLAAERARLTCSQSQEEIEQCGFEIAQLSKLIEQGVGRLQKAIQGLEKDIELLGPVNLVALDEVEGAKSRLNELESQYSDVQQAVLTLEEAIRRLDLESRQRLRQALEGLNQSLAIHFAAMFGGGSAQLIPTGTDLLSSGLQLWAEPPGKKNVSLHLLSGGEKALTAISLMLALFELNPAPFCLLDEVDAPLDDANTARLAKMLVQLSEKVQCVYISHHRLTMEVAEQLVGVTMPEAGVSKVVEVDMQSALAWAGAQKKKGVEAHG